MAYRIPSLDGGGIRGVLTARPLERIEAKRPGFLAGVDLFAGTSTGAILALLSVGPGTKPEFLTQRDTDWGIGEWNFKMLDLLFDGGSGLADYQCRQLIGDRYLCLDDVGRVDLLLGLADACDLQPALDWIDGQWQ